MIVVDRSTAAGNENAVEFPKYREKQVRSLPPSRECTGLWGAQASVTVGPLVARLRRAAREELLSMKPRKGEPPSMNNDGDPRADIPQGT